MGINVEFNEHLAAKGWDGRPNQRGAAVFADQPTFHPTKHLVGTLNVLKEKPKFYCFTRVRIMDISEKGVGIGPDGRRSFTSAPKTVTLPHAVMR